MWAGGRSRKENRVKRGGGVSPKKGGGKVFKMMGREEATKMGREGGRCCNRGGCGINLAIRKEKNRGTFAGKGVQGGHDGLFF